jgi:hypothetical protein
VARIPSLSKAVGHGLDVEEALRELFRRLRRDPAKQAVLEPPLAGVPCAPQSNS